MAISAELQAQILRYHHVEKWRANTIAHQLGVHHHTVQCVLARSGLVPHGPRNRPSQIDAYLPFSLETLEARGRLILGTGGREHVGIRGRIASEFAFLRRRSQSRTRLSVQKLLASSASIDEYKF